MTAKGYAHCECGEMIFTGRHESHINGKRHKATMLANKLLADLYSPIDMAQARAIEKRPLLNAYFQVRYENTKYNSGYINRASTVIKQAWVKNIEHFYTLRQLYPSYDTMESVLTENLHNALDSLVQLELLAHTKI